MEKNARYLSETPCKYGHLGERYVRTGNCCQCEQERSRKRCTTDRWRAYQRDYLQQRYQNDAKYREKKRIARNKRFNKKYKEDQVFRAAHSARISALRLRPDLKEIYKERGRERRKQPEVRAYHNAKTAEYEARKRHATPAWLSAIDREQMCSLYKEAKILSIESGAPYEVDHILPLTGRHVCGLHVPWNLQVIPRTENRKKNNKFVPGESEYGLLVLQNEALARYGSQR